MTDSFVDRVVLLLVGNADGFSSRLQLELIASSSLVLLIVLLLCMAGRMVLIALQKQINWANWFSNLRVFGSNCSLLPCYTKQPDSIYRQRAERYYNRRKARDLLTQCAFRLGTIHEEKEYPTQDKAL